MFGKLLKYEFRSMRKILLPVLLTALAVNCLDGLLLTLQANRMMDVGNDFAEFFIMLLLMLLYVAGVGCVIMTFILGLIRFRGSMFGSRAYLTHTLPVNLHQLLISKILVFWAFLTLACVVLLLSLGNVVLLVFNLEGADLYDASMKVFFRESLQYLPGILLNGLALTLLSSMLPVFSVCVGHSLPRARMGVSVALTIGIPYVFSFVLYLLVLLLEIGYKYSPEQFRWLSSLFSNGHLVCTLLLLIQLSVIALFYFVSYILTKKRLNLY